MRVLKIREVLLKTSLGKTAIYALIKTSNFPKPISLGVRSVGWIEAEIDAWILEKIGLRDRPSK
ncbi:AlpA family transcriptional regulator [Comamonas sp. JUb58]|uniref:AlpA family transcriptional regulator n=1 Tax=Comamonas sp. JUb58 TaxID=2485114 RepID=UPI00105EC275|nr:AlpA family transcriptional regulator [Comamonas sp. JUb58]